MSKPLEGGKRLGYKTGGAQHNFHGFIAFFSRHSVVFIQNLLPQVSDSGNIGFGFCGQADHKIKFDMAPAAFKGGAHCA